MKKERFFIFGYYGYKNTGDDAMLYALLQELRKVYPESEYAVLCLAPETVPTYVKDRISFVKPAPVSVFREVAKSSIFIIGGGTHVHDYGRCRLIMKNLLRLFIVILLAKLLNNEVFLVANGIGPISTTWGRIFTRLICHLADYITVRDKASYEILEAFGLANKVSIGFDLSALLVPVQEAHSNPVKEITQNKILGMCVTPVFENFYKDREKDLSLVDEIAGVVNLWLNTDSQLQVRLFIFGDEQRGGDFLFTKLLKDRLQSGERVRLIPYNADPTRTLAQVAQCYAFVGMKYHSCVFAYLSNVPLLVIEYHPKCRALVAEIGLPDHAIVSLNGILNGQFGEVLNKLSQAAEEFRASLPVGVARERARIAVRVKK